MPGPTTPPGLTYAQLRDRRARIAQAVRRGMSVGDAAAQFRLSKSRVYDACKAHGVRLGPGGVGSRARSAKRNREIAEAAKRGETAVSIAKRLGMSEQGVRSACARMGVRPVEGTGSRHQRGLAAQGGEGPAPAAGRSAVQERTDPQDPAAAVDDRLDHGGDRSGVRRGEAGSQ